MPFFNIYLIRIFIPCLEGVVKMVACMYIVVYFGISMKFCFSKGAPSVTRNDAIRQSEYIYVPWKDISDNLILFHIKTKTSEALLPWCPNFKTVERHTFRHLHKAELIAQMWKCNINKLSYRNNNTNYRQLNNYLNFVIFRPGAKPTIIYSYDTGVQVPIRTCVFYKVGK